MPAALGSLIRRVLAHQTVRASASRPIMHRRKPPSRLRTGLLVGNAALSIVGTALWSEVLFSDGAPAMDQSGVGLILLMLVRGY